MRDDDDRGMKKDDLVIWWIVLKGRKDRIMRVDDLVDCPKRTKTGNSLAWDRWIVLKGRSKRSDIPDEIFTSHRPPSPSPREILSLVFFLPPH